MSSSCPRTRTAIGKYGGGLAAVPPCDLAATVVREAVSRAGVDPDAVGHAVFGNVIHTEVRDMYLARVAAVNGGLGVQTPAFTVNRLCGSGLQAIVSAAQAIRLGDCEVAVAGGAESMSRGQYWLPAMRWGQRMAMARWSTRWSARSPTPSTPATWASPRRTSPPSTASPGPIRTRSPWKATAARPPRRTRGTSRSR